MSGFAPHAGIPRKSRVREWLSVLALLAYISVVLLATLSPTPLDQGYQGSIDKVLTVLHRNGVPEWFGYNKLEFSANIFMFIPLGFLITLLLPLKIWWLSIVFCPALSGAIELSQGAFLSARFASWGDVASNSIGALIGIIVAVCLRQLVYQRDEKLVERALWERGAVATRTGLPS
ncbi:VanZ family protein [Cryobacterium sp. PAMC25264]|uniref:VanZ family protein n=1 Tax=Cryobacterium sp. PAMC25264 TaxID=2861288 RepID=UPI001C637965|nr:VanZ family protein [Cryobacterium sp. PAMC25264]QYF72664.1 VanZ family protein [Cryobacterium sp. PAMC25264]